MKGVPETDVKILLSHDPTHWDSEVLEKTDIDLTLSGHTHGFQFGMEIPGFVKWSPVQYVYKHWSGLYEKAGQYLYVNRGLGFLGYMGRVGMTPEVTFITLRRK
jgi:predicted MPP superfamily phosphohydrolase